MSKSSEWFSKACQFIPGGVNSPVRAWKAVGGEPFFVREAKGSKLIDEDGNTYIDYVCSWGPLILGHAHHEVVKAVQEAAAKGLSYGAPSPLEVEMAEILVQAVPSLQKVRLVNSGTEATLSAIRLARAFTKRDKIIKMIGGYHGHHDALLASAGSGIATLAIPSTPGVPASVVEDTILVQFNDAVGVHTAFEKYPNQIAAVIVEPVAGNMGVIPPEPGYLDSLRQITIEHGALLIFDEVMTGFRVARGGAQERYHVLPDLTTLGKVIGGGMPIGAYGGREDIMNLIAPQGNVYQAGTLSGNPVAVSAGLATLQLVSHASFYANLEKKSGYLVNGLFEKAREAHVPIRINAVGSMLTVFFSSEPVRDMATASKSDTKRFAAFWQTMLSEGIYLPPSAFEAWFVSNAHTEHDIDQTIRAAAKAFKQAADLH